MDCKYNFEKLSSNNRESDPKSDSVSCIKKIRVFFAKKVQFIKENSVYLDTLSVQSIRRSMRKSFKIKRSPKKAGYVKFLTDEEKRLVVISE